MKKYKTRKDLKDKGWKKKITRQPCRYHVYVFVRDVRAQEFETGRTISDAGALPVSGLWMKQHT